MSDFDAVIVGAGHNGLVAACYLAMAGRSVCIVEASERIGGAAISAEVFPGVPARLSKYSYLVSLLPEFIREELGIDLTLARRTVTSFTPDPADPSRGLLVTADQRRAELIAAFAGGPQEAKAWDTFYGRLGRIAQIVFPTLGEPLPSREALRERIGEEEWRDFFERPLGEVLERTFENDVVRGVVLTDALIGTFADAHDPSLIQNICFLYHVIGNGTGDWDLPVGGMGAVTGALERRARELGVEIRTGWPVERIEADADGASAIGPQGTVRGAYLLANCAPAVLDRLLGRQPRQADSGAQIKVNMLLRRLPRLRDASIAPEEAFAGTFHINEGYAQLQAAFAAASAGRLPNPVPVETYCHSLSDRSILGAELDAAGAQTLTAFALQTPHALFADGGIDAEAALAAVERSLDSVLAEPIRDCLWLAPDGTPCIEVHTTADIERLLRIPGGNIFHTPLDWPFATSEHEIGTWGVATDHPRVVLCGSGARRGGGVSGIPGHNAAHHVLDLA